ncbi:unnamed protein product, partial [marine sediment metagenome]
YDDGRHERISAFIGVTQVTVDRDTARAASTAAWIHGPINMVAKHKKNSRIIIQIDTRFFISDTIAIGAWYEVFQSGGTAPADSYSRWDEMGDYLMVFNSNGIFKLECSSAGTGTAPCMYWKANEAFVDIAGITNPGVNTYKYRYIVTRVRIPGTSITRSRVATRPEQQTAPFPLVLSTADYSKKDYNQVDDASAIGAGGSPILNLAFAEEDSTPYTHWGIYRTLDTGVNGIDGQTGKGNNKELYVWVRDLPII